MMNEPMSNAPTHVRITRDDSSKVYRLGSELHSRSRGTEIQCMRNRFRHQSLVSRVCYWNANITAGTKVHTSGETLHFFNSHTEDL